MAIGFQKLYSHLIFNLEAYIEMKKLKIVSCITFIFTWSALATLVFSNLAIAGTNCTANCGNGYSVSCSGAVCGAIDGIGCRGSDANGKVRSEGFCLE